jgi:hypothetical protein
MNSTTITISERTRRELLSVAGELQSKRKKKVDYEEVIEFLLLKSKRNERLLLEAVFQTTMTPAEIREVLLKGRTEDQTREGRLEGDGE